MNEVAEVRGQLDDLSWLPEAQRKLLRYIVAMTWAQEFDSLAEKDIAQALHFGAGVVRSTALDLRAHLKEYYEGPGAHWQWRITIPKGKYRAVFEPVSPPAAEAVPPPTADPVPPPTIQPVLPLTVGPVPPLTVPGSFRNWGKSPMLMRIGLVVVGIVFGVVLILSLRVGQRSFWDPERFSTVLRGFSPALLVPQHTAGVLEWDLVSQDLPFQPKIDWYQFGVDNQHATQAGCQVPVGGGPAPALEAKPIGVAEPTDKWNLKKQLHFHSTLTDDFEAWTGFFFWSQWPGQTPPATWSFPAESDLTLILFAKNADVLEIGLRDATKINAECKLAIQVKSGWAGYRLPLADFQAKAHQVDSRLLELLIIAHSRKRGSASENTFAIALITTTPPLKHGTIDSRTTKRFLPVRSTD